MDELLMAAAGRALGRVAAVLDRAGRGPPMHLDPDAQAAVVAWLRATIAAQRAVAPGMLAGERTTVAVTLPEEPGTTHLVSLSMTKDRFVEMGWSPIFQRVEAPGGPARPE